MEFTRDEIIGLTLVGGAAASGLISAINGWRKRHARKKAALDPLDYPLMHWSEHDVYSVRDLLNGGCAIFGRSGSGKTSSSGATILDALVGYPRSGGLIIGAKASDADDARRIFTRRGRLKDLYVINTDGELRLDFIDYIRSLGGDSREISRAIMTIGETLRQGDTNGVENAAFWQREQERCLFNAVEPIRLGLGKVTATDIQRFIVTAATEPSLLHCDEWKAKFHNQVMHKAFHAQKTDSETKDFQGIADYWCGEWCQMAPNTRASIMTGVMGILHVFSTGIVRTMCSSGDSNISPDEMQHGKWIFINLPPCEWGDSGRFVGGGWKYLTQKSVLKRRANPGDGIVAIWLDEASQWINSFDGYYLAQCRSHLGCQIILTQSLHSIFGEMKGEAGVQRSLGLLTNFSVKVFHALGSAQDAQFASSLAGKSLQSFITASSPGHQDMFRLLMGQGDCTSSFSERWEAGIQPHEFMNGLRCGGKRNGLLCDAIVIKSGEPFADGQNWKWITFSQS